MSHGVKNYRGPKGKFQASFGHDLGKFQVKYENGQNSSNFRFLEWPHGLKDFMPFIL